MLFRSEAKEERMRKYLSRVMRLMKRFEEVDFVQIPREENVEANTIAKEASANEPWTNLMRFSICQV